jgi:hypothetical protein
MAKIIVEYKLDKNHQGGKVVPYWVDDGGVWYDPDNFTYVGIVKDPEVKIPNTVVRLTKETFVERQMDNHDRHPFKKDNPESNDPIDRLEMTDEEVTTEAETWWDNNADS